MTFATLDLRRDGHIAVATFTRPAELNSLTPAMFDDLERVLDTIEGDLSVRAFVMTGEGRGFCVGLDLELLDRAFGDIGYFEAVVRRLARIVERLEALPIPTLAAVNGFARAGGFELAMGCDFIVVGSAAKIGDAHTDSGVLPATVTARLARRIGLPRAKELLWSARWLTPTEAVDYGLALRTFPQETLVADSLALLRTMVDKPRPAIAALKASLRATADLPAAAATEHELEVFTDYMGREPYGREGYRAFVEKRQPSWRVAD
jgi:enoyl-CoA hydratase/carnithine racemase